MSKSKQASTVERMPSGVRGLDKILGGGLVKSSITVIAGSPGAGKTTLAQQICFHNATPTAKAIIFQTLSEPPAKTMRYMSQFGFFDPVKMNESVEFVDLGAGLRANGIQSAVRTMLDHIRRVKPTLVIVDSFKVFEDLTDSRQELRKFAYEVAVQLMAWEITGFLLGEYGDRDLESSPLFSVVDGILTMKTTDPAGSDRRVMKVVKMRGTDHHRSSFPFDIGKAGIVVDSKPTNSKPTKPKR